MVRTSFSGLYSIWEREHNQPRYILDQLLSVINVSVLTVLIVKELPNLKFG
ncbi:MAG: hypothetical protein J6W75_01825 [Bacteroidaceae bacterium]|nr:hypothetical protein [Bacteroidaceae bacterium]